MLSMAISLTTYSGTGYTIPFSCYNTTIARTIARLPFPTLTNASDTALGEVWAGRQAFAEACYENAAEYADVLGTAFVARDMLRIAEALDDDGLLRYWGFSYGTVLGATTAAMFPDKIDRMVLDGVVNSHQWYGGSAIEGVVQADTVLDGFFESCISNPGQCPLAQDSNSAEGLSQTFYTFLDTLKYNPIIIGDDPSTDLINYSLVKGLTFGAMYTPSLWPILAIALHTLLGGNITAIAQVFDSLGLSGRLSSDPFSPATPDALYGIQCGDTSLRSNNLTSLRAIIDPTVANSRLAGESFVVLEPLSCAPWPFFAKERYSGDFQAQTRSPIIFVGGPFDPVTPLVSARNISAGFDGSVVLQHNGYGVRKPIPGLSIVVFAHMSQHTSLGQASLCTAKNIQAYFRDGVLPSAGTVCSPDQVLFTNETTVQTLEPLLANVTKRAYSDDAHLLRAITHLSKNVRFGRRV